MPEKVKVLVVDDSAVIRQLLSEILGQDEGIEVVGSAPDPYVAREKIKRLNPDVLTLDVEMPRMDGITFLRNLMRLRPMPVVMVSTLTEKGAAVTMEALSIGAVDFIAKPKMDQAARLQDYAEELVAKVRSAAHARVRQYTPPTGGRAGERAHVVDPRFVGWLEGGLARDLIVIGASTGGTEAIKDVLVGLPSNAPGIVIAQHIPPEFSRSFAERMHRCSALDVKEAEDGDVIERGHAYIAPGGYHLRVQRQGGRLVCRLDQGERVNRHRPSVDVLFDSVIDTVPRRAVGVLLTGMGRDGAEGLLRLHQAGARTLCQDEASSIVWGMPGEAVKLGAADEVLPLEAIAEALVRSCSASASV